MTKILVVDDEGSIRNTLRDILEYEGYKVDDAENGIEGLKLVNSKKYDLILLDIKMAGMDGIETLEHIMKVSDTPVVMISGHGTIETAVEAIKKGAYDYIAKPLDLNRLLVTIRNAVDKSNLIKETKTLRQNVPQTWEMIGNSPAMIQIKELIDKVAPSNARVLIHGSNGTGKELVARWLHEKSQRAQAPFIEVNCAAIPSELIESQLFGHKKGSFTSAIRQRKGDFELAHGGTLFLDEIGDMSHSAQAKVLRALQENKITRVGGEKDIQVDVRILAATNKNLKEEIDNGNFREDLYHRLSVIIIEVPDLNKRDGDIPLLADHFMDDICKKMGKPILTFSKEAYKKLEEYQWTGNVRELRNVVERLAILCDKQVTGDDIDKYLQPLK